MITNRFGVRKEYSFFCSYRKQYTSLLSYKKHLAVHAAEEGNLECQICSERFDTKEEILYHLKIHAGSRTVKNPSEKKFNCDHCDRKFFTKKDVRRHLVVHTGQICGLSKIPLLLTKLNSRFKRFFVPILSATFRQKRPSCQTYKKISPRAISSAGRNGYCCHY